MDSQFTYRRKVRGDLFGWITSSLVSVFGPSIKLKDPSWTPAATSRWWGTSCWGGGEVRQASLPWWLLFSQSGGLDERFANRRRRHFEQRASVSIISNMRSASQMCNLLGAFFTILCLWKQDLRSLVLTDCPSSFWGWFHCSCCTVFHCAFDHRRTFVITRGCFGYISFSWWFLGDREGCKNSNVGESEE